MPAGTKNVSKFSEVLSKGTDLEISVNKLNNFARKFSFNETSSSMVPESCWTRSWYVPIRDIPGA